MRCINVFWVNLTDNPGAPMLRWISLLAGTCFASAAAGLGVFGSVDPSARGWCLVLTALSATMLISLFDAYETEAVKANDRSED